MPDVEIFARRLHAANVASVEARYPGHPDMSEGEFSFDRAGAALGCQLTAVQLIKAARCFAYQSCEVSGWEQSPINAAIEAMIAHAITTLPGYNDAPWGVPGE